MLVPSGGGGGGGKNAKALGHPYLYGKEIRESKDIPDSLAGVPSKVICWVALVLKLLM